MYIVHIERDHRKYLFLRDLPSLSVLLKQSNYFFFGQIPITGLEGKRDGGETLLFALFIHLILIGISFFYFSQERLSLALL